MMLEENGKDIGPDEIRLNNDSGFCSLTNTSDSLPGDDLQIDTFVPARPPEAFRGHRYEEPLDESMEPFESHFLRFYQSIRPEGIRSAHDHYASEENRLNTFIDWKHQSIVWKEDLARNGFTFTGTGDKVRCVFCGLILRQWDLGDIVEEEHRKGQPECPFLLGQNVGNIPLLPLTNGHHHVSDATSESSTRDQNNHRQERCLASSRCQQVPISGQHTGTNTVEDESSAHRGMYSSKPIHPHMSVEVTRLDTFKGWPAQMNQKPEQMAQSGFFYTGDGDRVVCFHCGLLVHQWEPTDDPFKEHAKWYPNCEYLRLVKGDQFVKDVRSGRATEDELMALPAVQALMMMDGYSKECVERALNVLRDQQNVDIAQVSAETLLRTIMELEASATGFTSLANEHSPTGDFQSLRRENESLREKQQCKICMEHDVEVIFYPCKHFVCCETCSTSIFICPICREIIKGRDKVFMA